ncbi:MAG TPA: co-chaperone GroES [Candidatus Paceibacterota bacterium]|nr:co-chaperone GroES [Candidatus Paceibacterota bacterium]
MAKKLGITPIDDRIVVRPLHNGETKLASGILIPETTGLNSTETGQVVAVGPGKFENGSRVEMQVKTGDVVLFDKQSYESKEIKIEGEKYYYFPQSSVIGIVNK